MPASWCSISPDLQKKAFPRSSASSSSMTLSRRCWSWPITTPLTQTSKSTMSHSMTACAWRPPMVRPGILVFMVFSFFKFVNLPGFFLLLFSLTHRFSKPTTCPQQMHETMSADQTVKKKITDAYATLFCSVKQIWCSTKWPFFFSWLRLERCYSDHTFNLLLSILVVW